MEKTALEMERESSSLRSRHGEFFKRLAAFIDNYARGVCGVDEARQVLVEVPIAAEPSSQRDVKLRR